MPGWCLSVLPLPFVSLCFFHAFGENLVTFICLVNRRILKEKGTLYIDIVVREVLDAILLLKEEIK